MHNGSLSNHNALRRELRREGIEFQTDNDTEVAAGYLTWRLREGDDARDRRSRAACDDLDGFYTFAVGTADGFAVLRDPIACKPAVLAETDDWVAMASEYRAIAVLPGAEERARSGSPRRRTSTRGSGSPCDDARSTTGTRSSTSRRRRCASSTRACTPSPATSRAPLARASTRAARTTSPSGSTPTSRSRSRATSATTAPA